MTPPHSPFNRFRHLTVAAEHPATAANGWCNLFGTPVVDQGGLPAIAVGDAWIVFSPAEARETGVTRVGVCVADPDATAAAALAAGVGVSRSGPGPTVELSGMAIELYRDEDRSRSRPHNAFTRIHHVVVAVRDLPTALSLWKQAFAFSPAPEGPEGILATHHVPVGDAWFGLTSSGTDADALARFIQRRGDGVYAIALVVNDRGAAAESVAAAGGHVIGTPADLQVFVHPSSTHGVLLELAEEWPGNVRRPTGNLE
jgi:catechol 2,3-dioxygenase-like lactoylglutathione lyase family enzyme